MQLERLLHLGHDQHVRNLRVVGATDHGVGDTVASREDEVPCHLTGDAPRLPSGPLHDAVEMSRVMPAVMMFASSSRGLSHCKEEDTPEPHLAQTIEAFLRLVDKTVTMVASG